MVIIVADLLAVAAKMNYTPLSSSEEEIASKIVDSAFLVHKALGPGLLESVYETCFCHELTKHGLKYCRQVKIPIMYDDITFDEGFRIDVLVENLVICEIKAVEKLLSVHDAQLLSYLKLTGRRLGFLINFNMPLIKHGIRRKII